MGQKASKQGAPTGGTAEMVPVNSAARKAAAHEAAAIKAAEEAAAAHNAAAADRKAAAEATRLEPSGPPLTSKKAAGNLTMLGYSLMPPDLTGGRRKTRRNRKTRRSRKTHRR